jgi:hypothetical protein
VLKSPPILWISKGGFIIHFSFLLSEKVSVKSATYFTLNFERKQQGELAARLVSSGLVCVVVPAVSFDASGPTRIIPLLHQRFLTRASFLFNLLNVSKL